MTKIYSVYNILCKVLIFLFPLVLFLPQQFYRNLYVSIPFWIVIGLGIFLLPAACIDIKRVWKGALFRAFVVYLVCLEIVVIFSTNIIISMPVLFLNMAYFSIFLAGGGILRSQAIKESFAATLILVVFVLSLISFYNTVIERYSNVSSEGLSFMWGYFGHNHLAVLLILIIPMNVFFIWFCRNKLLIWLYSLVLVFSLCSLLIAFSRGAIIALVLSLLSGSIFFRRTLPYKKIVRTGIVWVILIFFITFSGFLLFNLKASSSFYTRSLLWQKSIEMFKEKYFFGFGPVTFSVTRFGSYASNKGAFYVHNILLQSLAEGGVVLFFGNIYLFGALLINVSLYLNRIEEIEARALGVFLWIGLFGVFINEMVDFDMQLPVCSALFWLISSFVYSSQSRVKF